MKGIRKERSTKDYIFLLLLLAIMFGAIVALCSVYYKYKLSESVDTYRHTHSFTNELVTMSESGNYIAGYASSRGKNYKKLWLYDLKAKKFYEHQLVDGAAESLRDQLYLNNDGKLFIERLSENTLF